MILAGDIGGTKTLLAVYQHGECIAQQQFASADFDDFSILLASFLQQHSVKIKAVCLGVAGPIAEGNCITTNLPWNLKSKEIAEQTGGAKVKLLNDLEAAAWGVLSLAEDEFFELNPLAKPCEGNIAVLAAGTGLGEAVIAHTDHGYHVMPTEGGHTDFAPTDETEISILQFLMEKYAGHVSYERLVSGMGIDNLYDFYKSTGDYPVLQETEQLFDQQSKGAVISERARQGQDEICTQAMQRFCRIYGAEAGNLALKALAYGGVVLAGGIAPKNIDVLKQDGFMQAFLDKGRYTPVLQNISVKVCMNPQAPLLGAVDFANRM